MEVGVICACWIFCNVKDIFHYSNNSWCSRSALILILWFSQFFDTVKSKLFTHWDQVAHIWVSNLITIGKVNGLLPDQWNFNLNSYISMQDNSFEYVIAKMSSILSQPQCVECKAQSYSSWPRRYPEMILFFTILALSVIFQIVCIADMMNLICIIRYTSFGLWWIEIILGNILGDQSHKHVTV